MRLESGKLKRGINLRSESGAVLMFTGDLLRIGLQYSNLHGWRLVYQENIENHYGPSKT